jgi:hypothetical protein
MATRITTPEEGWNQNKQRSPAIFYDQHRDTQYVAPDGSKPFLNGRPWWCYVERAADGAAMPQPVGSLTPLGWDAPWLPDDKYITRSIGKVTADGRWMGGFGGLQEQRFRIDYQNMMSDFSQGMKAYYRKAIIEASGQKMKVPQYGEAIEFALRQIIGDPPKSPKIPEAALAGNKWLLGQQQPMFDERTQKWVVEEDEQLSRLLSFGEIELESPMDTSRRQATDVEAIRREFEEFKRQMQTEAKVSAPTAKPATPHLRRPNAYASFIKESVASGMTRSQALDAWRNQQHSTTGV